jgi:hypothetical protein
MSIFKKSLLAFLFIQSPFFIQAITLDPQKYATEARSWVATLAHSSNDLQIVANLLYISYQRSLCTLESQDAALKTVQSTWHGWQNIAQTRMNPSKKAPYKISTAEQKALFQNFLLWQERHALTASVYANATEHILHEHTFTDSRSLDAIIAVRSHAREVVVSAFYDAKKILAGLFNVAQEALQRDALWDDEKELVSRFDLLSNVWNYLPSAALSSFLETEKIYTKASEQTWNVLQSIQSVNQQLWNIVETERASYYLAYYNQLYALLVTTYPETLYLVYDEDGFIENQSVLKQLPDLSKTW